jgi:excisionase family DNA binding protein
MSAISVDDFCELENISRPTWYRLVKRGEAPRYYKVGSRIRIEPADHVAWREQRKLAVSI